MPTRLRTAVTLGTDLLVAAGAVLGGAWLAYAAAHGANSSITLLGYRISFVPELLIGSLLAAAGLFRGVHISWTAERDRQQLTHIRHALAGSRRREIEMWDRIERVLNAELTLIAKRARIGSEDRVSFFIADPVAGGLRLTNRYSGRQTHRRVDPERLYPDDAGCLGRAWDSEDPIYENFSDPQTELRRWTAELRTWGIGKRESESMTLKARTIFARRVDTNDLPGRPLGVVVVESLSVPPTGASEISESSLRGHFGESTDLLAQLFELAVDLRAHRDRSVQSAAPTRGRLRSMIRALAHVFTIS
jgi:hypothetical protein